MRRLVLLVLLLGLSFSFVVAPTEAAITDNPTVAARAATDWLRDQQLPDGSFPGFSVGDKGFDPIFAFVAAGIDPRSVAKPGEVSLLDYAESQAPTYAQSGSGAAAKALLAAYVAGADPRSFGSVDLVAAVTATYNTTTGIYGSGRSVGALNQSLALLALDAVGETVPPAAIDYLTSLQMANGGWEYAVEVDGEDTNTTALAIQALVNQSGVDTVLDQARSFLRAVQNADGGFPYSAAFPTDANSTGYVLQAIAALGETPADWARDGSNPMTALLEQQNASGAFRSSFGPEDDVFATLQAVPGLLLRPLPIQLQRVFVPLVING